MRASDLNAFRETAADLACTGTPSDTRDRLLLVPTRAAASCLTRSIEQRLPPGRAVMLPEFATRNDLHARFADRLVAPPSMLSDAEREVLMAVACDAAIAAGIEPPFRLRPGLIAAILEFYDTLQRHRKQVDTFERLTLGALEPGAVDDRGAERLVRQTRFLVAAYREFERLRLATTLLDEHLLRDRLLDEMSPQPWRHIVVAVGDRAFDQYGLFAADWDLLARIHGVERLDVLVTENVLAGSFHEQIHQLLPGITETRTERSGRSDRSRSGRSNDENAPNGSNENASNGPNDVPVLLVPPTGDVVHIARDREEEVAAFGRWVRAERPVLDRVALIVRHPLPYVYLTRSVLQSAGIPAQMFDALPLAAEPFTAAFDLVCTCVTGNFGRLPVVALLRSPHFTFGEHSAPVTSHAVAALDRAFSEARYLGDLDALEQLVDTWDSAASGSIPPGHARHAARVLLAVVRELAPLRAAASPADHLERLLRFLDAQKRLPASDDQTRTRLLRGRAAVIDVLAMLRDAFARFDARPVTFEVIAAVARRWIEARTFAPRSGDGGVHIIDADSARFGRFDCVQLAGLIEGEWPERPRKNIFYPASLLRELGWPSDAARLDYARAAFTDLLRLPVSQLRLSTFTLEDDAMVAASPLIDAIATAGLPVTEYSPLAARIFDYEALACDPVELRYLGDRARAAALRRIAAGQQEADRKGSTAAPTLASYAVSGLERYQDCPFKFFAANVLGLEEPADDDVALSPRVHGKLVHEVFQHFFATWDARGNGAITVDRIDEARRLIEEIAAPLLDRLSSADAALERMRLFGSAASVGIADRLLGLEASRPGAVRERWLEHRLEGHFSLGIPDRRLALKGVADRIDLLDDNRLRVIDYKSGHPPTPGRALQAAVYALCAQEQLAEAGRGDWSIDDVSYVAFSGKRVAVPMLRAGANGGAAVLNSVRERVCAAIDGIEHGEFSPRPYDVRICTYCAYPSVCRKDYVGDD